MTVTIAADPLLAVTVVAMEALVVTVLLVTGLFSHGFISVSTNAVEAGTGNSGICTAGSAEGDGCEDCCSDQALFHG